MQEIAARRLAHSTHHRDTGKYASLDIAQAIQSEAALLNAVAIGEKRFGFLLWQCAEPCLVVPRKMASLAGFAEASHGAREQGYPVSVRETGGGAVVQSPGMVNISIAFIMPTERGNPIGDAYRILCTPVMQLLRQRGVDPLHGAIEGAMCDGAYNIVVNDRKLAGTAQRWRLTKISAKSYAVLGHLALSLDADHSTACRVVNQFHASTGVPARVKAESHVNWAEIASPAGLDEEIVAAYHKAQLLLEEAQIPTSGH